MFHCFRDDHAVKKYKFLLKMFFKPPPLLRNKKKMNFLPYLILALILGLLAVRTYANNYNPNKVKQTPCL